MSCILYIETATSVCSVALSQDGEIIAEKECREGCSHATMLAPMVEEMLSMADSHALPLDAVAVSQGPGSYTGLRIGTSTAKGLCYGREAKLLAIPTLQTLAVPVLLYHDELPDEALLCPMIDARRMEVYCAIFDRALREVEPTQAKVIETDAFAKLLDAHPIFFFGDGAAKCRDVICHPNAHFIDNIVPTAKNMMPLAERALATNNVKNVAYYEPFYLKEFVTTVSKKNVLK